MKKQQFIEEAGKAGHVIGPIVAFTLKADMIFRHKQTREITRTIPAGTRLSGNFVGTAHVALNVDSDDVKVIQVARAAKYFGWKRPGIKTLEKYSFSGVARTVTGKRVEPDGIGEDGSPSWLLVLGYI